MVDIVSNFGILKQPIAVEGPNFFPCVCGKQVRCYTTVPCTNLLNPQTAPLAGKENFQSWMEIEDYLRANGGEIVSTDQIEAFELAKARLEGHLFIDTNNKGFVWRQVKAPCL